MSYVSSLRHRDRDSVGSLFCRVAPGYCRLVSATGPRSGSFSRLGRRRRSALSARQVCYAASAVRVGRWPFLLGAGRLLAGRR